MQKKLFNRWSAPVARNLPKEGCLEKEDGRYSFVITQTTANYGFSVVAKVKVGREQAIRDSAKTIEHAVKENPQLLAPLKLHFLRWILFDVGSGLHFMYHGILDTDFDTYIGEALALFNSTGITKIFVNLEGWPEDWKTNVTAVIKFFRERQLPSFLEYNEYPYPSDEIEKALKLKAAILEMLDNAK